MISTGEIGELTSAVMPEEDIFLGVTVESLFEHLLADQAFALLRDCIAKKGKWEQLQRISGARVKLHQVAKLLNRSPDVHDLCRFYNVGLFSALKVGHWGIDLATGLNIDSTPSAFLTSVENDAKGCP